MGFYKKTLIGMITLFFVITGTVEASDHSRKKDEKKVEFAIHTYGGGELLTKVFDVVAMVIYGHEKTGVGKTFNGIVRIALTIGGFSAICLAFFREKIEPFIKSFFLPGLGIVTCLLVPRTTILIEDHLVQHASTTQLSSVIRVSNVPLFLGKVASLVSTLSYYLTDLLTNAAHGVNEPLYNWTGKIFAAENIFRTKKCRISNPVVEDNFREFCRECVFRDVGLGLYTKEQLIHEKNLIKFLSENTSNLRTVRYKDLSLGTDTMSAKTIPESSYVTCKEAIGKMSALLGTGTANTKELLLGEIGNELRFLLDQKDKGQQPLKDLIKQQIAINILKEELPGSFDSFAAKRAELLQKENQKILGATGVKSIVALRNFFEAVIYLVFPLIILVALMSFGVKALIQWLHFVVWINTWPVFYVVINFLLNSIWNTRKSLLGEDSNSLTVFSSEGLGDLYGSMEAIAAAALAFIPFLSWMLIKGGVSQMAQMASSIMAPAQAAASTAAGEAISGNYSFGNVSLESVSGYNTNTFKQNTSAQLSQGSIGMDSASQTLSYDTSNDKLYLKQGDSSLREGISRSEAFSSSLQTGLTHSEALIHDSSMNYSKGLSETSNKAVGFMEALAKHEQTGTNFNTQEMASFQKAYQYISGISEDYAQAMGVSKDVAIRETINAGLSAGMGKILGIRGDLGTSFQDGVSHNDSSSFSQKGFDSKTFQDHMQTLKNTSYGEVASSLGSEDARLHRDFVESLSSTESSMEQLREAYSTQQSLSEIKNYAESSQLSVHQNLNQSFIEFLREKFEGDVSQVSRATELSSLNSEKRELISEFVQEYLPQKFEVSPIATQYEEKAALLPKISIEESQENRAHFMSDNVSRVGRDFGDTRAAYNKTASLYASDKNRANSDMNEGEYSIHSGGSLSGNEKRMKGLDAIGSEINVGKIEGAVTIPGMRSQDFNLAEFARTELETPIPGVMGQVYNGSCSFIGQVYNGLFGSKNNSTNQSSSNQEVQK